MAVYFCVLRHALSSEDMDLHYSCMGVLADVTYDLAGVEFRTLRRLIHENRDRERALAGAAIPLPTVEDTHE